MQCNAIHFNRDIRILKVSSGGISDFIFLFFIFFYLFLLFFLFFFFLFYFMKILFSSEMLNLLL